MSKRNIYGSKSLFSQVGMMPGDNFSLLAASHSVCFESYLLLLQMSKYRLQAKTRKLESDFSILRGGGKCRLFLSE
jgi:hypothetical protein